MRETAIDAGFHLYRCPISAKNQENQDKIGEKSLKP